MARTEIGAHQEIDMRIRRGGQARRAGSAMHRHIEGSRFGIAAPAKHDATHLRKLAARMLRRWRKGGLAESNPGAWRLAS